MNSDLPPHLGGQMGGNVDLGLVSAACKRWGIGSLLDIGCGDGYAAMRYADELGLHVTGIDGDWTRLPDDPRFVLHDFTQGPVQTDGADLAYSVEFLEHVEERYLPNVMPVFAACKYAAVTAARPGQGGHHHVNCRPTEYWIEVFREYGMRYLRQDTMTMRQLSTLCKAKGPRAGKRMHYFQRTGMCFARV